MAEMGFGSATLAPVSPYGAGPPRSPRPPERPTRARRASPERSRRDDATLLEEARHRFHLAEEAESDWRALALDDWRFYAGEQWDKATLERRAKDGRPCMTINRLKQFAAQVINEQRQNHPAIRVQPVDSQADIATAKILQGLIRHIEVSSDADSAYATAFEHAVIMGRGYFRILTEYTAPMSFEQTVVIRRLRNPFCVYMDPSAHQADYGDARWGFVVESMSRSAFLDTYDVEPQSLSAWGTNGDDWVTRDTVRVAEYFTMEFEETEVVLLASGEAAPRDAVPEDAPIVDTRTARLPVVWWYKLNGYTILERTRWPGRYIPIIPVLGGEVDLEGRVDYSGIVRGAKDAQIAYNYMASAEAEAIGLAPRAPFIGAEGQFAGYEHQWGTANTLNHAYLQYRPRTLEGGGLLPPPQRQVFEPAVQAITQARQLAAEDMKAVTGLYDASLGARSNETSGKAISARQQEGDTATAHYFDNFARALKHTGRVLIDLIPRIYGAPRVVRIIGEDGEGVPTPLNQPVMDPQTGVQQIYAVGVGTFDVVVDVGPSYQTRREQAVDQLTTLVQAFPPLMEVAGDLLISAMDVPKAQEIAMRLQQKQAQGGGEGQGEGEQGQQSHQMLQDLQQMAEQLQGLTQENQQLKLQAQAQASDAQIKHQELQLKAAELQLKARQLEIDAAQDRAELALKEQQFLWERSQPQPVGPFGNGSAPPQD